MADESLAVGVAALLEEAGLNGGSYRLERCPGSGNNRVFVVHVDGTRFVAKWYYRDSSDERDRLAAEYAFLEYAYHACPRAVPAPIARRTADGLALYEYIEGRKLASDEIGNQQVQAAVDFFHHLNAAEHRERAATLHRASEACFRIADQLALIEARVDRLGDLPEVSHVDAAAIEFVGRLRTTWREIKDRTLTGAAERGLDPHETLPADQRCISPSDFGFHNALCRPDGSLCFLDFEYAGWDDPAKMAGDFFVQPALPVADKYRDEFVQQAMAFSRHAVTLEARCRLLEPVFRFKWCCIMLNHFLPASAKRRRFADAGAGAAERKWQQLERAKRLHQTLSA